MMMAMMIFIISVIASFIVVKSIDISSASTQVAYPLIGFGAQRLKEQVFGTKYL